MKNFIGLISIPLAIFSTAIAVPLSPESFENLRQARQLSYVLEKIQL